MSFVKQEHIDTIKAFELLRTIESNDLDDAFVEVDIDPEDEVTEGFTARVFVYPDDEMHQYFIGCWDETPLKAAQGLIDTLKKEGFIE